MEHSEDVMRARACLAAFTPERPMIVSPSVMKHMLALTELRDLMDRTKVWEYLPAGPTRNV